MSESTHIAVLPHEAIDALAPRPGGIYVDATLGGGTHTAALLERSAPNGHVISFDVDPGALGRAQDRFASAGSRWQGIEANFRHLAHELEQRDIRQVDGILADLGFSSDELANPNVGLSFQLEGALDMRLGPLANDDGLTAAQVVNSWRENEISKIIWEFGEDKYARKIAAAIVHERKAHPIVTTTQLANIIRGSVGKGYEQGRIDPATRTFQALRIIVNDELDALRELIRGAEKILAPHGRLAIIAFHSIEDRIVKEAFKTSHQLSIITKKPLVPSDEETRSNPRARTAKLRIAEKT